MARDWVFQKVKVEVMEWSQKMSSLFRLLASGAVGYIEGEVDFVLRNYYKAMVLDSRQSATLQW